METIEHASGQEVRLAIRPEDVELHDTATTGGENTAFGVVESAEYLGAFVRVTVQPASWDTVVVADVSTDIVGALSIREGGSIGVSLPADKILVYQETH